MASKRRPRDDRDLPIVTAVLEADDQVLAEQEGVGGSVLFNARAWVEAVKNPAIEALVAEGGGPGDDSDEVARFFEEFELDDEVVNLMSMVGRSGGGFSVTVDLSTLTDFLVRTDRLAELGCQDELLENHATAETIDEFSRRMALKSESGLLASNPDPRPPDNKGVSL